MFTSPEAQGHTGAFLTHCLQLRKLLRDAGAKEKENRLFWDNKNGV
jgi:hypothetical protein